VKRARPNERNARDRARASMRPDVRKRSGVEKIERCSIDHAENSCDPIRLRVQSEPPFGCSIRWTNKRRSITELNSDSHSQRFIVKAGRRKTDGTLGSCGVAPALKRDAFCAESGLSFRSTQQRFSDFLRNAGPAPAFCLPAAAASRPRLPAYATRQRGVARRTEFISVSGQCSDRSAHNSDLRLKRTSGGAAATQPPRAPMNSSCGQPTLPGRVVLSTIL
jgi:hypothetical protein